MISYLLPTRNRADRLGATLAHLGALSMERHRPLGGAEIIVVDDASARPVGADDLPRGALPLRVVRCDEQMGAAARTAGARAARGTWLIMLDDDSWPLDHGHLDAIASAEDDLAGFGACITLPCGRHEDGGLPEVLVGCGAALRRDAFLEVGGYDASFHYYAEEYDLAAKLLAAGWRLEHDWRFRVFHGKVASGRDMNRILRRLVRNNGWVVQRYAPPCELEAQLHEVVERYRRIAGREKATRGYEAGLEELMRSIGDQRRVPMSTALWERFTAAHARMHLATRPEVRGARLAVVDRGKNAREIDHVLHELDATVVTDAADADVLVVGTLSPGPMIDARDRRVGQGRRVVTPWMPRSAPVLGGAPDLRRIVHSGLQCPP